MKKCINHDIGQMIGLYEFDKLSPEDKKMFESHLLKCDACFQDLYEFSPVVKTIQGNIGKFREAVTVKSPFFQRVFMSLYSYGTHSVKGMWQKITGLPRIPRYAISMAVVALLVVLSFRIVRYYSRNTKTTQKQQFVLQEPEEMEQKAAYEEKEQETILDEEIIWGGKYSENEQMWVNIEKHLNEIIFSWAPVDGAVHYHIDLIENNSKKRITPQEGIQDNHFTYTLQNIKVNQEYAWELSGDLNDGKHFIVRKEFVYDN